MNKGYPAPRSGDALLKSSVRVLPLKRDSPRLMYKMPPLLMVVSIGRPYQVLRIDELCRLSPSWSRSEESYAWDSNAAIALVHPIGRLPEASLGSAISYFSDAFGLQSIRLASYTGSSLFFRPPLKLSRNPAMYGPTMGMFPANDAIVDRKSPNKTNMPYNSTTKPTKAHLNRISIMPVANAAVPLSFWRRAKNNSVFCTPIMMVSPTRKRICVMPSADIYEG